MSLTCKSTDDVGLQNSENYQSKSSPVKITEYPAGVTSNPTPFSSLEKAMIEDYISSEKLKELSGKSELSDIIDICLHVNTSEASIGNIGDLLVNLKQLKLTDSYVSSIRDLGSSLGNLTSLSLAGCGLDDLEGIVLIPKLKEFYLAYNNVMDLSPLSMMEELEVLDLEGNNVDDISQIEFLSLCFQLSTLVLEGNPVQMTPQPNSRQADMDYYDYRRSVVDLLPSLRYLDNRTVTDDGDHPDAKPPTPLNGAISPLDNACHLVHDSLKFNHSRTIDSQERPGTSAELRLKAKRPRPTTANAAVSDEKDRGLFDFLSGDTGSQLTRGNCGAFCGSAGRALRQRIKNSRHLASDVITEDDSEGDCRPTRTSSDNERLDLFEELRQWRIQFDQKQRVVPCDDAPQPSPPVTKRPTRPHTAAAVLNRRSWQPQFATAMTNEKGS